MIILRQKEFGLFGGLFNKEGKRLKEEFENKFGMSPENYYSSNLPPKVDLGQVKRVCSEIEKLNDAFSKIVERSDYDYLLTYSNIISFEPIDYKEDSRDVIDYLKFTKKLDNDIPIVNFSCMAFEDVVYSGYIFYDQKSKKFMISNVKSQPKSLKDEFLVALDILLDYIESDANENYDGSEFSEMQKVFKFWKCEYYEKAKNIIKQIRI